MKGLGQVEIHGPIPVKLNSFFGSSHALSMRDQHVPVLVTSWAVAGVALFTLLIKLLGGFLGKLKSKLLWSYGYFSLIV